GNQNHTCKIENKKGCICIWNCSNCKPLLDTKIEVIYKLTSNQIIGSVVDYEVLVPHYMADETFRSSGRLVCHENEIFTGIDKPSTVNMKLFSSKYIGNHDNWRVSSTKTGYICQTESTKISSLNALNVYREHSGGFSLRLDISLSQSIFVVEEFYKHSILSFFAMLFGLVVSTFALCKALMICKEVSDRKIEQFTDFVNKVPSEVPISTLYKELDGELRTLKQQVQDLKKVAIIAHDDTELAD